MVHCCVAIEILGMSSSQERRSPGWPGASELCCTFARHSRSRFSASPVSKEQAGKLLTRLRQAPAHAKAATIPALQDVPLPLGNVGDLPQEHRIGVTHETVRLWWRRFGPLFASGIGRYSHGCGLNMHPG